LLSCIFFLKTQLTKAKFTRFSNFHFSQITFKSIGFSFPEKTTSEYPFQVTHGFASLSMLGEHFYTHTHVFYSTTLGEMLSNSQLMEICVIPGKEQVRSCIKHPIRCSKSMGKKGPLNRWLGISRNQGNPKARQNLPVDGNQDLPVEVTQDLPVDDSIPTDIKCYWNSSNSATQKTTSRKSNWKKPTGRFSTFYR
jgi:hypothetical protein